MIRRLLEDRWLLFTQDDHARLAGELAAHVGNGHFTAPAEQAVRGITLHDCGWPGHDDSPTLNQRGEPHDVFESPRELALPIWSACATGAAKTDLYAGLLTSIHVLHLSIFATGNAPIDHEKWDTTDTRTRFAVNQFQHDQIELQEQLRKALKMRADRPLKHGLAEGWADPSESALKQDFRLLQAMDQLSLNICCTKVVAPTLNMIPRVNQPPRPLQVTRLSDHHLIVDPWPFNNGTIKTHLPCRSLPARPFVDLDAFRDAYHQTKTQRFDITLSAE